MKGLGLFSFDFIGFEVNIFRLFFVEEPRIS